MILTTLLNSISSKDEQDAYLVGLTSVNAPQRRMSRRVENEDETIWQ